MKGRFFIMAKDNISNEGNNNTITTKSKYWVAVGYPENMVSDWQEVIADKLQRPGEYCIHNKDAVSDGSERKEHVHIILVFPSPTTYKHALSCYNELSKEGCKAFNTCERVIGIKHMHDYLIHDTETCRKQGKYQYSPADRKSFNNFDIGAYEQLSASEKEDMAKELCDCIMQENFTNFADFYMYVVSNFDKSYFEIIKTYSGLFERLTKGNYQKQVQQKL